MIENYQIEASLEQWSSNFSMCPTSIVWGVARDFVFLILPVDVDVAGLGIIL